MKRRDFLKTSSAVAAPIMINGFPLHAEANNALLQMMSLGSLENGRKLVIIQLNGGNDGLNTVFPKDQYAKLLNARTNLLMPEGAILPINGFAATGLHPALTEVNNLFSNGVISILQGVSYPNPSFSHFRATDIWFTGSASNVDLNSGWVGRHLNEEFPSFPDGYPNPGMPDPLAVQIGSQASMMTQGPAINMCMTVSNPDSFYQLVDNIPPPAPGTPYGAELTYIRNIKRQSNAYNIAVRTAFNAAATLSSKYPAPSTNRLADQLKIVARLIKGGLKTPVFIVNHQNSFDTHSNQVDSVDRTKGSHANMLSFVSKALDAFMDDIKLMGKDDLVFGMTHTEFGRQVRSNASNGTDHGAGVPMFFFGKKVNPAVVGINPVIADNPQGATNIVPMQFDFRAVYYTILKKWFELTPAQLANVMFTTYPEVNIFAPDVALPVNFLSFKGRWVDSSWAELTWVVDEEINIEAYEIWRSVDGASYEKIGTIEATNASIQHSYTFTDKNAERSIYYYRVQIIEKGGLKKNSEVVLLKKNVKTLPLRMKVMPNPIQQNFNLAFDERINGVMTVRLVDMSGREVWKRVTEAVDQLNMPMRLSGSAVKPGMYIMEVELKNEKAMTKVMVQ
jgi:uncharacterized protein (DUF1501 family)